MSVLDKAKASAAQGRMQLKEAQARQQRGKLLRQLGEASYAEHCGDGTHEPVTRALAALDAQAQAHPQRLTPTSAKAARAMRPTRAARDIMHAGAECIDEGESVAVAAKKMRDLGVGSLPICGADGRLHGIITDRDVVVRCLAEGRDPAQVRTGDLMEDTLFWVDAQASVAEVLDQMEDHQVKRLPVIENHSLVGIITEADLAQTMDEHLLAEFVEKVYARA